MRHRHDSIDRRAVACFLWMLTLAPALAIVVFYAGVFHARLVLGRWPTPSHPDPKEIDSVLFAVNYSIITITVVLTSLSPVAWIAMLPVAETFASLRSFFVRIIVYLTCLVILLTLARTDPGGFVGWFLD
jgi:hypothetical protein